MRKTDIESLIRAEMSFYLDYMKLVDSIRESNLPNDKVIIDGIEINNNLKESLEMCDQLLKSIQDNIKLLLHHSKK